MSVIRTKGLYFDCQIPQLDPLSAETVGVVDFTLEEGLSELFTLTINIVIPLDIDINSLILKQAMLTVYKNGLVQREIRGRITEMRRGKTGFARTFYTLVIRPQLWMMTQRENSRIFHHQSIPEVINVLMKEHGINYKADCRAPHLSREYITQKRESDYLFISRLAAEEGISFWFDNDRGMECCVYTDSRLSLTGGLTLQYNDHPQNAVEGDFVQDIILSAKMTPQSISAKDRTYKNPGYNYLYEEEKPTVETDSAFYGVYESYARFPHDEMGKQLTKYRLQALQAESEQGEATSNCIALKPGKYFALEAHPSERLNRQWQIVRIVHQGTLPQSLEEESGQSQGDGTASISNHFLCMSAQKHWRPPFKHKPLADGPEVATVVGPEGQEIFTNKLGQVRVHFHWNRYDKADGKASCWIRVAQGWSGDGYGFYAVPRIGQEVIVSYLDGNLDRPIITGCTYNGADNMPIDLPQDKTQTVFRTKTHKGDGFNEIRFDDVTGKERFFMHAQYNMDTEVRNDRSTQVDHDHSEKVDNNQTITIGVNQQRDVGNNQTLTVGNDQTESIGSNRTTTIGSNDTLTVQANQTETVFIAKAETIGAAKALTIGGAYQISVGGAMNTSVGLSKTEQVGLHRSVKVGKTLSIEVADVIELRCGKSVIRMDKAGCITINGKEFDFAATGPVQITGKDIDLN